MMRRLKPISVLTLAFLLPLSVLAAEATGPAAPQAKPKAKVEKKQTDCESSVTTRIHKNKAGECPKSTQPTRTYTKEELDSTGQTDIGEALKRLDPRFQ